MTIVVIWEEAEHIFAAADTRVTAPREAGGTRVLTDAGAKISSLQVVCHELSLAEPGRNIPYSRQSYGFAFAGSTLVATMTYATATTLLGQLCSPFRIAPPAMRYVVDLVTNLLNRYRREVMADCEVALFGHCPVLGENNVYYIRYDAAADTMVASSCERKPPYILGFGSGLSRFQELIDVKVQQTGEGPLSLRIPKHVVVDMIKENVGPVGGGLAIALANAAGCQILYSVEPIVPGEARSERLLNGVVLDDALSFVGEHNCMPMGLA